MGQRNKVENIVVVRFSALGDVAMCIPVLYSVCLSFPDCHFTFVTRKSFAQIFVNKPQNLTVHGIDLNTDYKGFWGMNKLSRELGRPDVLIDLHSVLRTHILASLMRIKGVRVITFDKGREYKRQLTKVGAMEMSPLKHTIQRYAEAFQQVPMRATERFNGLFADTASDPAAFAAVSKPKAQGERWIGIAPFAAHLGKIYPLAKMQQVFDALSQNSNYKIFLFGGGADETKILSDWAANRQNVVCVAGKKLGFAAELSLMNHLDVMLCMDSGNMHLAAIAGTRVVSIWGATHPSAGFAAWRTLSEDYMSVQIFCRPCSVFGNKPCRFGHMNCLRSIQPQTIIAHINKILA
jgi:ADP-heptose:LPS heptosyltransferase